MATKKKAPTLGGAPATVKPAKVTGVKNPTVANVLVGGEVVRTYSKDEHGASFLDHAKEFAGKEAGRSVVTE